MDRRAHKWTTGLVWALASVLVPSGAPVLAQDAAAAAPSATGALTATTSTPVASAAAAGDASMLDLAAALAQGDEPMTADRAAELARASSPSVESAVAAGRAARAAAREAVVAAYPRVDLEARYSRLSNVDSGSFEIPGAPAGTPPAEFPSPLLDRYALEARLTYPVSDLFLSILPRYRAARDAAHIEELNADARRHSTALSAREAFYEYARAKAARSVAEVGVAQARAQLADVRAFVQTGALARVEQMRAEAQVASAEVALAGADGGLSVARTALLTLVHLPDAGELAVREDLVAPLPALTETPQALVAEAMRTRVEVLALRRLLEVQARHIDAYGADGLPHLGVGATFAYENPSSRVFPEERAWTGTWALSASLRWSPSEYAAGSAGADRVAAQRVGTEADLRALEDAVRVEVSQAVAAYHAARQAIGAALVGVSAAEESFRVRREQFRAGAAVGRDVIDADAELRRARLQLVDAAIDARVARARLDRAVQRN